ncbi:MAG: OmpA family protein [bacterium]
MRSIRFVALALATTLVCAGGASANAGGEVGITLGIQAPDEHLGTEPDFFDQLEAIGGLRGELFLNDKFGVTADGLYSQIDTNFPQGIARMTMGHAGLTWYPQTIEKQGAFFVSGGGGWMWVNMENGSGSDFDRPFASLGVGQRFLLGETATLRWEVRGDATFWNVTDIVGIDMIQAEGLVTLSFPFGGFVDADGDGVSDRKDECPDTVMGAMVDAKGCALDADGDGVPDGIDTCADTPKGAKVDATGCPMDSDGDGIFDGLDKCANTPKGAKVDATGCPSDADGDGVFDGIDTCPNTPKGAKVDAKGCPVDSDGDGVFDGIDQCANTPKGTEVDERGCPMLFKDERSALTLEGVNFETNSDVLTGGSMEILDGVAESLKAWPEVRVEVGGHTDSQGNDSYNLKLSEKRAQSVMRYLISRGVGAGQLEAKGYGETAPVADNGTSDGRAKNRRVELKKL